MDETEKKPQKATLRINLKCPRERELLEKYYNERRVLDTSVPKEVVHAFKLKEEKQQIKSKKQLERYRNIVENEPEKLEKIREQGRKSKQQSRQRLKEQADNDTESVISSTLFPSCSEASYTSEDNSSVSNSVSNSSVSNSVCSEACSTPRTLKARKPRKEQPPPPLSDRDDDFSDDTVVEEPKAVVTRKADSEGVNSEGARVAVNRKADSKPRPKSSFFMGGMRF
ncbi:MAG: hypothetical protein EBW68_11305 [Actinobacteria bacterium]|nr:hypothetical protein [Actinomycetota bacterium]